MRTLLSAVVFATAATATVASDANLPFFFFPLFPLFLLTSATIRPGKTEEFEGPVSNIHNKRVCLLLLC